MEVDIMVVDMAAMVDTVEDMVDTVEDMVVVVVDTPMSMLLLITLVRFKC